MFTDFAAGRKLMLGGVEIPHRMGLVGHSDADVVCHALINAIFGAMAKAISATISPIAILDTKVSPADDAGYGLAHHAAQAL